MKDGKKTDASVAISTAFHDRNKEKGLNSPSSTNQTRNLIMINYNSDNNQPWSYQVAINECKRIGAKYKFVRYENGGLMLCINSPSYGWFPYRGSDCYGQRA